MRRAFVLLTLLLVAPADPTPATALEIRHLLEAVEASPCTFVRNGRPHTGAEARSHMERKYDYVKKRVKRSEDFIALAASKSSMTGRPYQVVCEGEPPHDARAWLLERLRLFRVD